MASNYTRPETGSPECCICKTEKAEFWCDNCSKNYCSDCCELVHKQGAFLNHRTTNIREKPSELIRCQTHVDAEIKYWCQTCEILACHDCLKIEHINHKYLLVDEVAKDVSIKLRNKIKELQSSLEDINKQAIQTTDTCETMNTETVTEVFASLRMMLDEKESTLKQQMLEIEINNKRSIDKYQNELKHKTESLQQNHTYFESIASADEHVKLLQINEQLTAYLNRFTKELDELKKTPVKTFCHVKGLDQLHTSIDDSLKQTIITEQIPEPVQDNHTPTPPINNLRCGGEACATCSKCTDWKWDTQKKQWNRSQDAKCEWLHLPKYHALLPWHYLCHCGIPT